MEVKRAAELTFSGTVDDIKAIELLLAIGSASYCSSLTNWKAPRYEELRLSAVIQELVNQKVLKNNPSNYGAL